MKPTVFNLSLGSALTFVLTTLLVLCGDAMAGSYKTLNTAGLAVGTQVQVRSSPKNTPNGSIEMEVYEWETAPGGGTYQCRILDNNTGQLLKISTVSLTGDIFLNGSCTAASTTGSACDAGAQSLVGNPKFLCIVATGNAAPVIGGANYKMAVLFSGPALLGPVPSLSGLMGE